MADLKKEKSDEPVKPVTKAGNEHDAEPTNVQIEAKKWKMKKSVSSLMKNWQVT